jgi:hypothetical protein
MNKRGQAETEMVMELGKLVLYVMLFLLLAAIFYGTYSLFFKQKTTPQQLDWGRVIRDISSLPEGRSLNVITSSEGYQLFLYGAGNDEPLCAKKACLCIEQLKQPKKCEVLEGVGECAVGTCAENSMFPASGVLQKGTPIPICRQSNKLKLGTC